jgi:arylsulfatase
MIMADDVGTWNLSAYHRGMMGGSTPNIDRIAREGALFTDYYGQQSCTAGRAAFITGQTPFRTGLLKVGMPAAKQGLQDSDPTIAELLKPVGYVSAQIGKNHLGDRNEYLPTVHGFDEFYGILYHLNAMEEPYDPEYPKDPEFHDRFGPRNILDTKATDVDDPTEHPRWGRVGEQTIADGGPLPPHPDMDPAAKTNMEDVDPDLVRRSLDFIDRSVAADTVLPLAQLHAMPRVDPPRTKVAGQERVRPLRRRDDGAGLGSRADSRQARRARHRR